MPLISTYYDGVVTESDRAKNLAGVPEYGVYGPEDFKVTAHPSIPFAVLVKKGRAHGHGVTDEAGVDQVVQCATLAGPASNIRWDLIVVRRNWQPELGGPSTLEVLQAGTEPQIPNSRIVGPGVEDDQPIFLVKWQGGVSAPVDFIDLRVWTGNGGLVAKHEKALDYLKKVGTEIDVNGAIWRCKLGTNDAAVWEKAGEVGKLPLFGYGSPILGAPSAGQNFLIQVGSFVGTSDGAGYTRLTLPKPFPNGLLYIGLANGDGWASGPGVTFASAGSANLNNTPNFWGQAGYGSKSELVYEMCNADGTKAAFKTHRVNYVAIGW